ncbi:MAG: hypothetical protein ACRD43_01280, partial [Pyrinomonadaceae bacterium]
MSSGKEVQHCCQPNSQSGILSQIIGVPFVPLFFTFDQPERERNGVFQISISLSKEGLDRFFKEFNYLTPSKNAAKRIITESHA